MAALGDIRQGTPTQGGSRQAWWRLEAQSQGLNGRAQLESAPGSTGGADVELAAAPSFYMHRRHS